MDVHESGQRFRRHTGTPSPAADERAQGCGKVTPRPAAEREGMVMVKKQEDEGDEDPLALPAPQSNSTSARSQGPRGNLAVASGSASASPRLSTAQESGAKVGRGRVSSGSSLRTAVRNGTGTSLGGHNSTRGSDLDEETSTNQAAGPSKSSSRRAHDRKRDNAAELSNLAQPRLTADISTWAHLGLIQENRDLLRQLSTMSAEHQSLKKAHAALQQRNATLKTAQIEAGVQTANAALSFEKVAVMLDEERRASVRLREELGASRAREMVAAQKEAEWNESYESLKKDIGRVWTGVMKREGGGAGAESRKQSSTEMARDRLKEDEEGHAGHAGPSGRSDRGAEDQEVDGSEPSCGTKSAAPGSDALRSTWAKRRRLKDDPPEGRFLSTLTSTPASRMRDRAA